MNHYEEERGREGTCGTDDHMAYIRKEAERLGLIGKPSGVSDILKEFRKQFVRYGYERGEITSESLSDEATIENLEKFLESALDRARSEAVGSVEIDTKALARMWCFDKYGRHVCEGCPREDCDWHNDALKLNANRSRILKVGGEALPVKSSVDLSRVEIEEIALRCLIADCMVEIHDKQITLPQDYIAKTVTENKFRILRVKE